MMHDKDRIFFRNYSIVLGVLAVMIIVFFVLARMVGMEQTAGQAQHSEQVSENTAPVAKVRLPGDEAPAQKTAAAPPAAEAAPAAAPAGQEVAAEDMGKQVFSGLCFSCHGTGLPNIPQLGNKEDWAPRIEQGMALLYEHAINGFTGKSGMPMPPKGGNPALTDDQVKAAVDYMVAQAK